MSMSISIAVTTTGNNSSISDNKIFKEIGLMDITDENKGGGNKVNLINCFAATWNFYKFDLSLIDKLIGYLESLDFEYCPATLIVECDEEKFNQVRVFNTDGVAPIIE